VFSRKSISDDFEDKGFIWTASGSVTILGLTVKLGYSHIFSSLNKYDDKSDKAYIELNFKF
jgi:hypothetical protein